MKRLANRGRWSYAVPAIAVLAGVLFGVSAATSGGQDLRPETRSLVDVVQAGNDRVAAQQRTVATLQAEVNALNSRSDSSRLRALQAQADQEAHSAGFTSVTGSVVSVALNDSKLDPSQLPEGANNDWLLVHQQDVQGVVNALWRGGATAMMLMDQRVISTSAVRCVGNTLLLQGRVYSPPFTITAMGDPAKLKAALEDDPAVAGYRQYVDMIGLGYDVQTKKNVTFPAYGGGLSLQYAKVPVGSAQ
ncbi:DUF881 domain-containing protein [Branchiibius cervicis]|uniref:DUF881 domain-containing protein n=1 Tax=Branchiibius cervicis TaxID=908252 RepID=A0ABW2AXG5_9MICO